MSLPVRKHPRLKEYNYSSNGVYFVTVCTKSRIHYLSQITERDDSILPKTELTEIGKIANKYINSIETAYNNIHIVNYVIMPDHIHLLIFIDVPDENCGGVGSPRPTLDRVIKALKRLITKEAGFSIWQESFFEEVIRNEKAFYNTWNYIDGNPSQWIADEKYQQK